MKIAKTMKHDIWRIFVNLTHANWLIPFHWRLSLGQPVPKVLDNHWQVLAWPPHSFPLGFGAQTGPSWERRPSPKLDKLQNERREFCSLVPSESHALRMFTFCSFVYLPSKSLALRMFTTYFVLYFLSESLVFIFYLYMYFPSECLALPPFTLPPRQTGGDHGRSSELGHLDNNVFYLIENTWNIAKAWTFGNDVFGQMENSSKMCDISLSLWVSEWSFWHVCDREGV